RWRRKDEALSEPSRIAVRVIHVEFARAPTLVDGSFVDHPGRIRVPRRDQPALLEHAEQAIRVVGQNGDRLTKLPVSAMARQEDVVPPSSDDTKARVVE